MSENSAAVVDIHDALLVRINEGILRVDRVEQFERGCQPMWSEKANRWYCGCAACTEWREV